MARNILSKLFLILLLSSITVFLLSANASAHSGKTDWQGGHTDSSTGDYHFHHGQQAHDHYDIDGDGIKDCPIEFNKEIIIGKKYPLRTPEEEQNKQKPKLTFWDVVVLVFEIVIAVAIGLIILFPIIALFSVNIAAELMSFAFKILFILAPILIIYLIGSLIFAYII